ncbi:MAG: hypothetical protein FD169_376 [Bacillota bacterium]|nr:MAG: hypothetical protein FD169_376 [Bacillota bacterium]
MPKFWRHRVTIITGGYGSGKTEVSINLALAKSASARENPIALVDLDIVNPYFRSRDRIVELAARGVHVIAPEGALRTADLPALPPSIGGSILDQTQDVVIDVGGDPAGARALGRFKHDLSTTPYDLYLVVNPNRPHTRTARDVAELLRLIEQKSRLTVTGLCNNANIMEYTQASDLVRGQQLLTEVTALTGIETVFTACVPELVEEVTRLLPEYPVLPLRLSMRPPWKEPDKI